MLDGSRALESPTAQGSDHARKTRHERQRVAGGCIVRSASSGLRLVLGRIIAKSTFPRVVGGSTIIHRASVNESEIVTTRLGTCCDSEYPRVKVRVRPGCDVDETRQAMPEEPGNRVMQDATKVAC